MNDPFETCLTKVPWCPVEPDAQIDWNAIEKANASWIDPMRTTPQDPIWHAEGDVWTHTRMVCESLLASDEWQTLTSQNRFVLFIAALLHDVGKPTCTKIEDGRIASPNHGRVGAKIARRFLYEKLDMTGCAELFHLRELIVSLIQWHMLPCYTLDRDDAIRNIVTVSTIACCRLLVILSEADNNGRICAIETTSLEHASAFRELAQENRCLETPYPFESDHSRYAYFSGKLDHPGETLYDDTWGEVVLMSGLPASGKDTYIQRNFPDMPVVSLDALRREMNVSWTDDQTPIINAAKEKAKQYLRGKVPFVWNATNLRLDFRRQIVRLCDNYGASAKIIYLESDLATLVKRNRARRHPVAETAYDTLLDRWEIPNVTESQKLEIVCSETHNAGVQDARLNNDPL